MCEMISEKLFM